VLRIQTLFIRIRILLFYFDTDLDPAFPFDPDPTVSLDPDLRSFEDVMYLRLLFIHLNLVSLSVGPPGPHQKAYFVKFSLPVNFVVIIRVAFACLIS
jgi:hypothetical protein